MTTLYNRRRWAAGYTLGTRLGELTVLLAVLVIVALVW